MSGREGIYGKRREDRETDLYIKKNTGNAGFEQNRIFTLYGYSLKDFGRMGSRKKTDAGLCTEIDCVLCQGGVFVKRKRDRVGIGIRGGGI